MHQGTDSGLDDAGREAPRRRARRQPEAPLPAQRGSTRGTRGDHRLSGLHIAGTTERQALVVPKDAIVLGQREPFVYVVDPESSTVRPVNVRLGVAVGDDIEVQGPLAAGMNVVIRGNERLRPGMPVRAEEAR